MQKLDNVLVSRWKRAGALAAKIGKGLSKDSKALSLVAKHWIEAIDPLHRYGESLKFYYSVWLDSQSPEPFFHWLDDGDGKELDVKEYARAELRRHCVRYLGPKEREAYEVIVESGKLVYKQSGELVHTTVGMKWIYVLSISRRLFVGEKDRGFFQHSSFMAGAAIVAAGRLVVYDGILQAIWSYSGHYCPTEENFLESVRFLEEQQLDLTNVKMCSIDDDVPPSQVTKPADNIRRLQAIIMFNNDLSQTSNSSTEVVHQKAI